MEFLRIRRIDILGRARSLIGRRNDIYDHVINVVVIYSLLLRCNERDCEARRRPPSSSSSSCCWCFYSTASWWWICCVSPPCWCCKATLNANSSNAHKTRNRQEWCLPLMPPLSEIKIFTGLLSLSMLLVVVVTGSSEDEYCSSSTAARWWSISSWLSSLDLYCCIQGIDEKIVMLPNVI